MKEESRKILDELLREHSCRYSRPEGLTNEQYESIDKSNDYEDKICEFLNSIPQIESHLCLGGYIQDENGTSCCHGDKVIYDENYEGTLKWDKKNARFIIASIYGDYDFTKIKSFVKDNQLGRRENKMKLFKRKLYSKDWHNLIKNPNDLPPHSNQVIVQCADSNESEISSCHIGQWILNRDTEVIAWIEKPQFWRN